MGSSIFILYGANGTPLVIGASLSEESAASLNHTHRLVGQLASTGLATTYRSLSIPSDHLVGLLGRIVSGLLGSGVLTIGDSISGEGASDDVPATRRGRRAAGATAKDSAGTERKPVRLRTEFGAIEVHTPAPSRRGRKPGSKNRPKAGAGKRGPRRPRIDASAPVDEPVRRRPGRPKKNDVTPSDTAASVKRKPGRSRKNAAEAEATAPKRPGRPPGGSKKGATKRGAGKRGRKNP